jgi:iron(III) transport system substrate-binding protein
MWHKVHDGLARRGGQCWLVHGVGNDHEKATMQTQHLRLVGALVGSVLALSACSAAPTTGQPGTSGPGKGNAVFDRFNALPADQQRDKARGQAKAEGGEISLYTSLTADVADAVSKAFTAQTGIKVTVFRGNSETVLQRVLQESSANRLGNDVVETDFSEMATLAEQGLLGDYKGANLNKVDQAGKFNHWTADRYNIFLPAWNTNLIKPGQEPRSWEDLADPRFDGKISLEVTDSDWYASVTLYWQQQGKSQTQIDDLWKAIVQGGKVTKGHTTMMSLLGAGQTGLDAMNYSYITERAKQGGAPVSYRSADGIARTPAFPRPNGVGMMRNAKHPAAAWLFYDWLLGDGQKVLAQQHLTPSTKVVGDNSLDGITLQKFPVTELSEHGKQWQDRYDALLRGVPTQNS